MKTKITVMIVAFAIGAVLAQVTSPKPTARIAQEQGTEVFYTWTPASPDFEIDPFLTVLPVGFVLTKDGNDLSFHLTAGGPSVQTATITVVRQQTPGDVLNWAGPKITRRETVSIEWIVYRSSIDPFFDGFGDVVLYPSLPTP